MATIDGVILVNDDYSAFGVVGLTPLTFAVSSTVSATDANDLRGGRHFWAADTSADLTPAQGVAWNRGGGIWCYVDNVSYVGPENHLRSMWAPTVRNLSPAGRGLAVTFDSADSVGNCPVAISPQGALLYRVVKVNVISELTP